MNSKRTTYINRRAEAVKENIRGRQQQGARSGGNNINRRDFNHIWEARNSRDANKSNNSREAKSSKDANNSMDRQKHWKHYQKYQVRTSTAVGMAVTAESLATAWTPPQQQ